MFDILGTTLNALEHDVEVERLRKEIQLNMLRDEIRSDLIDRDANDAKTVERYRVAAERGEKVAIVLGRANTTAQKIANDVQSACPFHKTKICASVSAFFEPATDNCHP